MTWNTWQEDRESVLKFINVIGKEFLQSGYLRSRDEKMKTAINIIMSELKSKGMEEAAELIKTRLVGDGFMDQVGFWTPYSI